MSIVDIASTSTAGMLHAVCWHAMLSTALSEQTIVIALIQLQR